MAIKYGIKLKHVNYQDETLKDINEMKYTIKTLIVEGIKEKASEDFIKKIIKFCILI